MSRALLVSTLILFGALTASALWHDGYLGIFAIAWQSFAGAQLFADLVIALVLVLIWLWHDARKIGRNPWPWLIATLATGGFGPLLYLLTRRSATPPL
ncbi:MAG: DUF2834 domain-containing protein [Gammaproteobacteria bacterium]|nr:DUF2834 domain-containing protein [Gammaproteobacteria bacterium]